MQNPEAPGLQGFEKEKSMSKNILVFGSAVVDLMAMAPHIPKPGETVLGSFFRMGPGGKGFNQAVAAHKAGGNVTMVSKIGDDPFGKCLLDFMESIKMDMSHMIVSDMFGTTTALIIVDENTGQNSIAITPDACGNITSDEVTAIAGKIGQFDYMLTQLEINVEANLLAMKFAKEAGVEVILNPAPAQPIPDELYAAVDIITPNEVEAEQLSGIPVSSESEASKAADYFFSKGVKTVVITLGERGAFVARPNRREIIPAFRTKALDTTGAGDAFNGGLVTALAEKGDIWKATYFANAVGALCVQKLGTSPAMPTRREIDGFIRDSK